MELVKHQSGPSSWQETKTITQARPTIRVAIFTTVISRREEVPFLQSGEGFLFSPSDDAGGGVSHFDSVVSEYVQQRSLRSSQQCLLDT